MSSEDTNKKIDDTETEEDKSSQDEGDVEKTESDKAKVGAENKEDTKPPVNDSKNEEGTDGDGETEEEEKTEVKKPAKKRPVKADDDTKEEKEDTEEEEEDEEDDDEDLDDGEKNGVNDDEKERKKEDKKEVELEIPNGKGTPFAECPRIEHFIKQRDIDQLKKLHQVLFGKVGKPEKVKSNLLQFKGFDYEPESDAFTKKKQFIAKLDVKHLKDICDVLDVEKKGKKEQIVTRVMEFLMEPKDSGKPLPPQPAQRPKRTSAVKANSRGYAGLDADESDDDEGGKKGRATGRRNKSRVSYKDESSSEDERRAKRVRGRGYGESDEESDPDAELSDESDSDSQRKKKAAGGKAKAKSAPKRKAPASAKAGKKTGGGSKRGKKKAESDSEGPSESEDEPLQKKSKKPPTDDEIKKYVKQILDGANLEEITMKTVCKQVYGRYPDHDLTHKKDLIKTTVKSLIAT